MEQIYCQSCGMPLTQPAEHGTEKDGSASSEYCTYCYRDGEFSSDVSMEEMIDHCLQFLGEFNRGKASKFSPEEARAEMRRYFPNLKRWKQPK